MSSEPPMPDDRELDEFLSGRSPISSAYRDASRETAPPELDAAVLAAARVPPRVPRRSRWIRPLAFAATFVLSLGVLLSVWREPGLRQQVVPGQSPASAPVAGPGKATTGEGATVPQPVGEMQPAEERAAPAEAAAVVRENQADAVPAPSPPKPQATSPASASMPERDDAGLKAKAESAPEPPTPAAIAAPAGAPTDAVEYERARMPRASDAQPYAAMPAAPIPRDEAPPGAARGGIALEKKSAPVTTPPGASSAERREPGEGGDAYGIPEPSAFEDRGGAAPRSADEWVALIRQLRDRGDVERARRELQDLRKAWPAYPIPQDVRALDAPAQ